MNKLPALLLIMVLFVSCKKDDYRQPEIKYVEIFQISYKLDGQQYSKVLKQNEKNAVGGLSLSDGAGNETHLSGPYFQLDDGTAVTINLGFFLRLKDDTAGNRKRIRPIFQPGTKPYKCLMYCKDTAVKGVEVSFLDNKGLISWCSTRFDLITELPLPVTNEQDGMNFTITSLEDATTTGYDNNAYIMKADFSCNMYDVETGQKKVLTEGKVVCLVAAY